MPYLIDSDILIAQREAQPGALALLEQLAPQGLAISIVTYMEVYQGTLRSPDPERARASLSTFLAGVPVVPFFTWRRSALCCAAGGVGPPG